LPFTTPNEERGEEQEVVVCHAHYYKPASCCLPKLPVVKKETVMKKEGKIKIIIFTTRAVRRRLSY
jgi:hypothetical protein